MRKISTNFKKLDKILSTFVNYLKLYLNFLILSKNRPNFKCYVIVGENLQNYETIS